MAMNWPLKIQGRLVTEAEVNEVRMLLDSYPSWNRSRLSRELCERWSWHRPDGQMKDMACRELLRKLESRNLITLPPRQCFTSQRRPAGIESVPVDQTPIVSPLADIHPVKIVNARDHAHSEKAFNYLLKEYHYLSYGRPVGQNMKYLIQGRDDRILGCLLFGAAAWKTAARDRWIDWPVAVRERNLGLICSWCSAIPGKGLSPARWSAKIFCKVRAFICPVIALYWFYVQSFKRLLRALHGEYNICISVATTVISKTVIFSKKETKITPNPLSSQALSGFLLILQQGKYVGTTYINIF